MVVIKIIIIFVKLIIINMKRLFIGLFLVFLMVSMYSCLSSHKEHKYKIKLVRCEGSLTDTTITVFSSRKPSGLDIMMFDDQVYPKVLYKMDSTSSMNDSQFLNVCDVIVLQTY